MGVRLEEPTFSHGQLKVADTIVGGPHHLFFAASKSASGNMEIISTCEVVPTPTDDDMFIAE